jgi:small subunit ribosomal protein S3
MGHKVNPIGIRIGITTGWKSRWFASHDYAKHLREDVQMRAFILKRWKAAAIAEVEIERSEKMIRLIIRTSRPGVLLGRGGSGIEDLTRILRRRFFAGRRLDIKVDVQEIKYVEESAALLAQQAAEQLEKRMPFRRVLKGMLDQAEKSKNVKGIKVEFSGRLGGAEMSRREWLSRGTLPLHTLRADIDFARYEASTTYGVIGVKVWLYKGEKFSV